MIRNLFKCAVFTVLATAVMPNYSKGQFSIAAGSTNYTQDFNTLTSGTWTNGTTLTGWYAKTDATPSITTYGANTGSTTTAGLYALGVAGTNPLTDRALGFATSNGFTGTAGTGKNYMGWRLKNNTGSTITSIVVTWSGEQWRKESSPAQTIVLSYQTGTTVTDLTAGTWTATSSVFTSLQNNAATAAAIDGNATANRTANISVTITVNIAPGDEIMLRWEDVNDSGNDHIMGIDDVTVNATASAACTAPTTQATAISAGTITSSGFAASWTAGNGAGTMIVVRPTSAANTLPAANTSYTANLDYTQAGAIDANNKVVFRSSGTSVTGVTGLTAGTGYTVSAYEYSATDCYNTSSVPTATFFTFSTEPSAHAASFTATAAASNQISLSFSAASTISNASGYIVLQKTGSAPTGLPADGQSYSVGNTIGDATVAAIVSSTSATSATINGLTANTTYYYTLIPYNWNGTNTPTYNYYTAATIPGSNATTPVATSSTSDITDNAGTGFYTTNIDYTQWQSASITSIGTGAGTGLGVFSILLRDGGASTPDADALPTTLTALTVGYTGTANTIRSAAIFDGATKVADGVVSANSISFSGLSVAAADNGSKALTLAVTFNTTVTDNEKLVFTVSSATAAASTVSSQFAAANAGGAASENNSGNDNNRLEVTATKLAFVQQPTGALVNAAMATSVTIQAADANNNRDLDYTFAVAVTSTGTLSGTPVSANAVNGLATFSGLTHTATGSGLTLTATSGVLTNATSTTFSITNFAGKLWSNSTGNGLWTDANNWQPTGVPTSSDDVWLNNDLVSGSYTVTISGNNNAAGRLKVGYSGNTNTITVLITGGGPSNDALVLGNLSGDDLMVDDGGVVNNSSAAAGSANRGIEFTSNTCTWSMTGTGKFIHNQSGGSFINAGSGNVAEPSLGANTTVEIQVATNWAAITGLGRIQHYGNLILNFSSAFITAETYLASGDTLLVKGNMELKGGGAKIRVLNSNSANIVVDVRGDLTVGDGCTLTGSEGTGTGAKIIVGGNVTTSGTGFVAGTSGTGNPSSGINEVILKGNFNGLYGSNSNDEKLTFDGNTTEASVQFSSSSDFLTIDINKPIKLLANVPGSRTINVNSGGVLNFNGFNAAGSGAFNVLTGGTLKITSPDGITATTASTVGNIVTTSGARSFGTGGIYQYTGSGAQVPGTGLPATVAGLVVNNAAGVTLSQPVAVSGAFTLTNGLITTSATNTLTINAGATISGGSSASFVNGPLTVKTNGTTPVALPVGKGTAYGPASVTPASATASTYTAEYYNGANASPDYSNYGTSNLVKIDTFQYWDISRTAGAAASVTVSWGAASGVTFGGDVTVAHYTGTAWENAGRTAATGTIAAGTVTSAPMSSFSPFTVGFTRVTPLPIKLVSFNAAKKQNSVALNWSTAEELAGDRFELERSENGKDYAVLTAVKANGHASEYNYTDAKPAQGKNYYRLAMIEANGKKQYSSVRIADMGNDRTFSVVAFPNPVSDRLTLQAANKTATASVQLTDLTGKVLSQVQMTGDAVELDMSTVAAGIYLVRYTDGTHTELFKIAK